MNQVGMRSKLNRNPQYLWLLFLFYLLVHGFLFTSPLRTNNGLFLAALIPSLFWRQRGCGYPVAR
jgi:Flp pilus assembly protein TadB